MEYKKYGITSVEAERRLAADGANVTDSGVKKTFLQMFLVQFCDLMIVILLVAAVLSFVVALCSGNAAEFVEPIIIVAIVLVNALLGALQEFRAERSLQALAKLASPKTKVIRDGEVRVIDSVNVVRGDCCLFEAGDVVTADCKVLFSQGLAVNESALTGESVPVDKQSVSKASLRNAQRNNCVYSGSFVVKGRCVAVVDKIGKQTEIGKIAMLLQAKQSPLTPLQQKLKKLSKLIGVVCLAVCGMVFVVGLVKGIVNKAPNDSLLGVFVDIFLTSVSLAVAAIPEGLPAVVTVVLARGVQQMAAKNAVVKRLTAVETLGCASVICTDKTGTLTQNTMNLQGIFDGNAFVSTENITEVLPLVERFADCCDVSTSGEQLIGDPTELAVFQYAYDTKKSIRMYEIPFDSSRKLMTTVVKDGDNYYAVTKGSPDAMSSASNFDKFVGAYKTYAKRGFRVLALSVKQVNANFPRSLRLESDFNIVGLFVIADPPREEAHSAVETCRNAGVRPIMVTGDGLNTAMEIAKNLGILQQNEVAIDGETLCALSDEQLANQVANISVYARVSPADKLRIVEAWQANGQVVAMTGDGVNDAPALQRADIGCAMGSGTEVAKNAADMILVDDNFATVVDAVSLGRNVYQNIKKAVTYLLTCNVGEVFCVFVALLLFDVSPLGAIQLLWVNLVTDGLPALALGVYKPGRDVMNLPPRGLNEGFFANGGAFRVLFGGVMFGVATLVGYYFGSLYTVKCGETMAFVVLSLSQLLFALQLRTDKGLFGDVCSPFMAASIVGSVALVALVAFVPSLASAFELQLLLPWQYLVCLALAVVPTLSSAVVSLFGKRRMCPKNDDRVNSSKKLITFS